MSPKSLIALGIVWLAAVVLWLKFGPQSFGYSWRANGTLKRTALIAAIYTFGLAYQVFILGWLVPMALACTSL
jgi:hypothetical protein